MRHSNIKSYFYSLLPLLFLSVLFLFPACSEKGIERFGEPIPSGLDKKNISEILSDPSRFHGSEFIVEGTVSAQCASLCEFYLQNGTDVVEMFPTGFSAPRIKRGTRLRVYTRLMAGEERVVFSALGIELLKEEK